MALIKPIETPSGAIATYWCIHEMHVHRHKRVLAVRLAGYVDRRARVAGKTPLAIADPITMTDDDFPAGPSGIAYAAIYAAAKRLPVLADAEDG